jgi:GLPGLI family protein
MINLRALVARVFLLHKSSNYKMKISTTMKKIILILGIIICVAAAQVVFGQTAEGVITYEVKVNVHKTLPPDNQEMKAMMPEFRINKDQLYFNGSESLYKPVEEEEDEEVDNGQGMRMVIRRPQNEIYIDQENSKRVMLQELMGKKYLIEDSLKLRAWKFGSETKIVKGYECRQASFHDETRNQNVTAWYTDKLRPFLGPENFNTLPGAVLQADINDGERVITATAIDSRPLKKGEMKIPTANNKVTEAEFRKLVNEQMERMRANGGNIIIRN